MLSTLKNLVLALAAAGTFATAAHADAPAYVRIRSISYAGTGCKAGSVSQNVSPDLQAFTLLFDNFVAQTGPGVPLSEARKNCQIAIDLDFPSGWSYSLATLDYRGFVTLDAGVSAAQTSSYYFQGQGATARLSTPMFGPHTGDWQIRDTLGVSALVYSPCGLQRALNINTSILLSSRDRNAQGLITTDSIDGQFKTLYRYGLTWQRCF
jgi:hypothetical protein